MTIVNARCHNLKNVTVSIPTGAFTCVTGVSGSGKSSLITEVLYKKVRQELGLSVSDIGECDEVKGLKHIDKVINISQDPIGQNSRSNPATYIKVLMISELYLLRHVKQKCMDLILHIFLLI